MRRRGSFTSSPARKAGLPTEIALVENPLRQAIRDECRQDPTVPKNVLVEINFPSFSPEGRAMLIESMTAMKDILEAAITRALKNKKKPT
jgi:hypothetical protein